MFDKCQVGRGLRNSNGRRWGLEVERVVLKEAKLEVTMVDEGVISGAMKLQQLVGVKVS